MDTVKLHADWFRPGDEGAWDDFVASSATGNMLHTRKFLSYHGDRFEDRSIVLRDDDGRVCALLPAARNPHDEQEVVSHPGVTYGGLVLSDKKFGLDVFAALTAVTSHLTTAGFARLLYKTVPIHLHRTPSQIDAYALWRVGATIVRRDLWNVVELRAPLEPDAHRARRIRRARTQGVKVAKEASREAYAAFHALLSERLAQSHAVAPVHNVDEMLLLQSRFPEGITLWLARGQDDACLAGEWIFNFGPASHGQYGAATEQGRAVSAQDLLLHTVMEHAKAAGASYFSFGTSTTNGGRDLNEGLVKYKSSFGPGTVTHDFYAVDLRPQ